MLNTQHKTIKLPQNKVYAVDLFCGAGGLTHGLERAGIDVRIGVDIDPVCEFAFNANNRAEFLLESVEKLKADDLKKAFSENGINLLAGCAPCQTFSTYNQKASQTDKRWWLLLQFSRLVNELSPELVTMENVPGLMEQNVFAEFVESLQSKGYEVDFQVVNCSEYGVPQHRNRLVLLASKLGPIKLLTPEEFGASTVTVQEVIGNLPPLEAGNVDPNDPLHRCSILSNLNLKRIRASRPGGTWRDWPDELVADCHKKNTGRTYPSVYGRMTWENPSPTMTTQFFGFGNGRFGHPVQDRAISLREGAILQSFPPEYRFFPPDAEISIKSAGRMIGNAVPVKLGEVIGQSIQAHVAHVKSRSRKSRSSIQ